MLAGCETPTRWWTGGERDLRERQADESRAHDRPESTRAVWHVPSSSIVEPSRAWTVFNVSTSPGHSSVIAYIERPSLLRV